MSDALAVLSNARKAVVRAHTVADCTKLVKMAQAVQAVADTEDMQRRAAELYLRARRRRGEIERDLPKARAGRPPENLPEDGGDFRGAPTQSERYPDPKHDPVVDSRLLNIPDQQFEEYVTGTEQPTVTGALRIHKDMEREQARENNRELVERSEPFPSDARAATTVIDPPWDWGDEGDVSQFGRGDPTYKTMPLEELMDLPVAQSTMTNAHLYLWITNRSLPKGFALLEEWGFRYVTCLTWCKPSIGMGNYFRGSTEQVLFAVRGSLPLLRKDVGTWFSAPRGEHHSSKPDAFYELVEECSPGPWRDLFGRQQRPGWLPTWGAEA